MMVNEELNNYVSKVIERNLSDFSKDFFKKHIKDVNDPDGIINNKINNIFVSSFGKEISFYSALMRSLDSSLGKKLELIGTELCKLNFRYNSNLEGEISESQVDAISQILNKYHNKAAVPSINDLKIIDDAYNSSSSYKKQKTSDFYLEDLKTNDLVLIELKLGGDLDNKKAESEKKAILEQYCILKNKYGNDRKISLYFATAYNKFGEGNYWKQANVRNFFSDDELLIGYKFWNFILKDESGGKIVHGLYEKHSDIISSQFKNLKNIYGL